MAETKIKLQQAGLSNGWEVLPGTFTYASATTINSSVDLTGVLQKGDKLMLNNTTTKYFYVVSLTSSVITVTGGSDYTVANAAITLPFFSKASNPQGFPQWFNYTITWAGFSSNPTPATGRFSIANGICTVKYTAAGNGTSNATSFTFSLPIVAAQSDKVHCIGRAVDNNAIQTTIPMVNLTATSATATALKDPGENSWTASSGKSLNFQFGYEI